MLKIDTGFTWTLGGAWLVLLDVGESFKVLAGEYFLVGHLGGPGTAEHEKEERQRKMTVAIILFYGKGVSWEACKNKD